jgi:hypothetical protein
LKETLNLAKSKYAQSEFDQLQRLEPNNLKIESIFESPDEISRLLEQRITRAVIPVAQSLFTDASGAQDMNQINLILENIAAKIPSVQTQHYFRAGKNYFTVNHQMGYAGNVFFKIIFDALLKESRDKSYQIAQENCFCVIYRS